MPLEIKMPQLSLTMESGAIVRWLVTENDLVSQGQPLLEVETDKAVVQVEAPQEGRIARILCAPAQKVPVGIALAVLTPPGENLPPDWQPSSASLPVPEASKAEVAVAVASAPVASAKELQASWKARAIARQTGADLHAVQGTGHAGRITAADLRRAPVAEAKLPAPAVSVRASPVAAKLAAALGIKLDRIPGNPQGRIMEEDVLKAAASMIKSRPALPALDRAPAQVAQVLPLEGVRGIVARRMAESARATARVALWRDVDATELARLRARLEAKGVKVSYNDLLVRVCAAALCEHPSANARLGEGQIECLDRVNIGLAVDTERGLLVPVIHNAQRLSVAEIAEESARLIDAARTGHVGPDDLSGGTFTITNLGMFGVEGFTPIINLPECCILGVGRIVRRPVVLDDSDAIVVRPTMTISLVFDHRIIDGAAAARFLDSIVRFIQDPALLL